MQIVSWVLKFRVHMVLKGTVSLRGGFLIFYVHHCNWQIISKTLRLPGAGLPLHCISQANTSPGELNQPGSQG